VLEVVLALVVGRHGAPVAREILRIFDSLTESLSFESFEGEFAKSI
jgi:hypothetical protein